MPIVDGRYEMRLSTVYCTVDEGLDAMKGKLLTSRKVRITNIPMDLLIDVAPVIRNKKDVKIILPLRARPSKDIIELGEVARTKAKIYTDYMGREAFNGSIFFSDTMFNILWTKEEIIQVSTMDYRKCVNCLKDTFEMAWRYSEKIKK